MDLAAKKLFCVTHLGFHASDLHFGESSTAVPFRFSILYFGMSIGSEYLRQTSKNILKPSNSIFLIRRIQ